MNVTLGFDTSGPYCGAAVYNGHDVVAARYEDMRKGQAERLMPMLQEVMDEAGLAYGDLTRIGVGVGPGNFTGIRISVSSARGLALALGIPAIGVTVFEALAFAADLPVLTSVTAPRETYFIQERHATWVSDPIQVALEDMPAPEDPRCICLGNDSTLIAAQLGLKNAPARFAPASAIARIAAIADDPGDARPTPYYLRPADAAPPRDPAPVIL